MLLTGWARAAGLRVGVVRTHGVSILVREATKQLGTVLVAAGFDLVEVEARSSGGARAALSHAQEFATIALLPVGTDSVDVWVADTMSGAAKVRRLGCETKVASPSARDLALQALEFLRSSLLEPEPKTASNVISFERAAATRRTSPRRARSAGASRDKGGTTRTKLATT
jgi:hypothetical protein